MIGSVRDIHNKITFNAVEYPPIIIIYLPFSRSILSVSFLSLPHLLAFSLRTKYTLRSDEKKERKCTKTNSNQIIAQDNRCTHQILLSLLLIVVLVVVAAAAAFTAAAVAPAAAIAMRYAVSNAFDKRMSCVYIKAAYFK